MKNKIRCELLNCRKEMLPEIVIEKSNKIIQNLQIIIDKLETRNILSYMPIKNEVDITFFYSSNISKHNFYFPIVESKTLVNFYKVDYNTEFKISKLGIREPISSDVYKGSDLITTALIPGIAFNKKGYRLGYGGGYYDRFFADKKILKLGLCYEFQLIDINFQTENDIIMDYIITENNIYKI